MSLGVPENTTECMGVGSGALHPTKIVTREWASSYPPRATGSSKDQRLLLGTSRGFGWEKKAFSENMWRDIHYSLYGCFFLEMWEKKCIWLLIVHEIYMKPNRRYQLSPRISVIVKNPPTTIIEKVIIVKARLDLLASQPTFCKGRKGEKKWVKLHPRYLYF